MKGLLMRRRLQVFAKAASTIQAYFRMTVVRKLFITLRNNVCIL